LSFCCGKRTPGETIYRVDTLEKPYEVIRAVPVTKQSVVWFRDTVTNTLSLTTHEKDSILSTFLGVKVFTREFQDTILAAIVTDTVQGNEITGSKFTYQLKKPFVTILPEKRKAKLFIGGGFLGNSEKVYIYPELTFLSKQNTYISIKYDPVNRLYGVCGGLKIGK